MSINSCLALVIQSRTTTLWHTVPGLHLGRPIRVLTEPILFNFGDRLRTCIFNVGEFKLCVAHQLGQKHDLIHK
jgi:hypothetical protein